MRDLQFTANPEMRGVAVTDKPRPGVPLNRGRSGNAVNTRVAAGIGALMLASLPISEGLAGEYIRSYEGDRVEVPARSWSQLEIEVEDDFVVDGSTFQIDLNLYAWNVNAIDLRLTAPDGTRWRFLNNRCGGVAIAFGDRGFDEITTGDPSFVTVGNETPDWYGFSDTSTLPALGGGTNSGSWCDSVWKNPDPTFPNGDPNPAHDPSLPWIHSNSGSWTKLPLGTYLGHQNSSFGAQFSGVQAKGTWLLEVEEWLNHRTYLGDSGPRTVPFVDNVNLTFITPLAELAMEQITSDKTHDIVPGDTVEYTVKVTNLDTADTAALNTISTVAFPSGLSLVSTSGCDNDGAVSLSCELGNIAVGESASYTFVARVDVSAASDIIVEATVSSDTPEQNKANNTATNTTEKELSKEIVERTERIIKNFMARRADVIVSNEVDLTGRLTDREGKGRLISGSFAVTSVNSYANINLEPFDLGRYGIWGKVVWEQGNYTASTTNSFLAFAGIDTLITKNTVLGLMGQYDWMEQGSKFGSTARYDSGSGLNGLGWSIDGSGWLAGPYVVSRLHENLIFDARAAYGQSYNTIEPYTGLHRDDFTTERWLATAKLSGDFQARGFKIMPSVRWSYFSEQSETYMDSLGNTISAQQISLGRLTFGPTVSRKTVTAAGHVFETSVSLFGLWDYDGNDYVDVDTGEPIGDTSDDLRARLEVGLKLYGEGEQGATLHVLGHYDGIGVSDLEAYGASIKFIFPLP